MAQNYTRVEVKIEDSFLDLIDLAAMEARMSRAEWIREACRINIVLSTHDSFRGYVVEELKKVDAL